MNQYIEEMQSEGIFPLSVDNLLEYLRSKVEEVLQAHGITSPPSQSMRAQQAIAKIELELNYARDSSIEEWSRLRTHRRQRALLQDFLAVHRTCYILEGRAL